MRPPPLPTGLGPPPLPPGVGAPRLPPSGPAARVKAWVAAHPRASLAGGIALAFLLVFPFAVGGVAAHLFASRATAKLGREVTVGQGRAGLARIVLSDVVVAGAPGHTPLATIGQLSIPYGAALGLHSAIEVTGLRVQAVRGGDEDNLSEVLARLRGKSSKTASASSGGSPSPPTTTTPPPSPATPPAEPAAPSKLPDVTLVNGSIELRDEQTRLRVAIPSLSGELRPGTRLALRMRGLHGGLAFGGDGGGPRFGADELDVETPLAGMHPTGIPSVRVSGGTASPLPTLALTGIAGVIAPSPAGVAGAKDGLIIDLRGSYGGAKEALWTAKGDADPARGTGKLALRAEQFSLARIADVLPSSVLHPTNTLIDAALDLSWMGDAVKFGGDLAVVGLSVQNDALTADPIENLSVRVGLHGTAYPLARRVDIERAEARIRDLTGRVSGHVAVPTGTFRFTNGKTMGVLPDIDLTFSVPRISCAKLLDSIPGALVPRLQGFVLQGLFQADVHLKVDFAHMDETDLSGKVGIDGCKVLKAPEEVKALPDPTKELVINVDVPKLPGSPAGETEPMQLIVGPDNPDFAPYDQISPYLVASIMTTEDNGFFKHHGWVSSQFKSALRRNLQGGGFRLGASSITMQMTKNVLLTKDKTLSRKFQELFLVWYLEQILPKERILELYFNAIEFGPRIYGIGAAARHYFGKRPADLTPLEAAFFSSILPSPKRRYVQYCHGSLSAQWDRYVRRILAKVHERGRISDDEYAAYSTQPFVFDRKEASFSEKQCLEWVKNMAPPKAEPETPPDIDEGDAGADAGGWAPKRLRKLFSHGAAKKPAAGGPASSKPPIAARTH